MPVAVMAESAFSFKKLLDQCENQELEAPGGIATPPVYGQLLALYLLHNDISWFTVCHPSIPPTDATRRRAFALVSQAYTSIIADDFAAFVGLPVEEAVKVAGALDVSFNRFIPLSECRNAAEEPKTISSVNQFVNFRFFPDSLTGGVAGSGGAYQQRAVEQLVKLLEDSRKTEFGENLSSAERGPKLLFHMLKALLGLFCHLSPSDHMTQKITSHDLKKENSQEPRSEHKVPQSSPVSEIANVWSPGQNVISHLEGDRGQWQLW
ncbi:hypothetical protein GH733_008300 [Mirounga leonina]|nr:hypothetical protein GH733_008300 [Mirounga leonina]